MGIYKVNPMLTHRDSKVSVPFKFSGEIGDECH